MNVDYYTWIFTSRIFRLALEITFLFEEHFFLQMAYKLLSQRRKLDKSWRGEGGGGSRADGKVFEKKKLMREGTLIRDPRVTPQDKNLSG